MTKEYPMKRLLGLAILTIALSTPSTAAAGTYDVRACHGWEGNFSWAPEPTPTGNTFHVCPGEGIVTANVTSNTPAPHWAGARHVFRAPPGTNIVRFRANVNQNAIHGWWAGLVDQFGNFIWGGQNGTTWANYVWIDVPMSTPILFSQITCGNAECVRPARYGLMAMRDVTVTVREDNPPNVAITGGLKAPSGWLRGDQVVQYSASDLTGIREVALFVGQRQGAGAAGNCTPWHPVPCGDITSSLRLAAEAFGGDGKRRVVLRAIDGANNARHVTRDVWIDNTPPKEPLDVTIDGGDAWSSRNAFTVRWTNPRQTASSINAARYRLCPATDSAKPQSCTQGIGRAPDIRSLENLRVPGPGEWRLTLWLQDAAGNADPEHSVTMRGLGLDETAPDLAFTEPRISDPARVRVVGRDATTRIGEAWIEARRRGESAWRSLPTVLEPNGFSAVLDDEKLPKGRYDIRARARDLAGNERTIDREPDGSIAARTLPIRLGTRLAVGRPTRVSARGSKGKRRYRTILVVRPRARFGRTTPIQGRLTMPGQNPLAGADIEVWQRIKLPGEDWQRVGQVRTSATGGFRFKALPGPSRLLKFRYPGTPTIRARSTQVDLRVSAVTSLKVTRRSVVNGEEVRFFGRLKGRQRGPTGKLIHLQVYTRGRWSTFATPRANRRTGSWRVPYRFTATRGRVTYRFRALVPRESTFPYETGTSKAIKVSVAGL